MVQFLLDKNAEPLSEICCASIITMSMNVNDDMSQNVPNETPKVATYRHVYRAELKEPTQFGSVSGSEIQNLPLPLSGIVSLYRSEPKEPT